ncbi:hypothetical protein SAMN05216325_101247 [Nitrosomonas marina]|uniref:Uncharacterized protein n=1 Tax=Nitrosomonas marina TaxID=917 RepID=A0A1H8ANS2_9PROT|nr:hypothetical protein SAMN05216325_101247 [Nitrosomonas marina]
MLKCWCESDYLYTEMAQKSLSVIYIEVSLAKPNSNRMLTELSQQNEHQFQIGL